MGNRLAKLRRLFSEAGVSPRTSLGQNFLLDRNQVSFIARSGELLPSDIVLEVGPGTGFLTREIAATGATVLAVELDIKMLEIAKSETADLPNVIFAHGDILDNKTTIASAVVERLEMLLEQKKAENPRLVSVSNLPYSAGTPFIANMFASKLPWHHGVFLIQKEVAERLIAQPGAPEYGALSIRRQLGGKAKIIRHVPPPVFWPRPKVASAVIYVDFLSAAERSQIPWVEVRKIASAVFCSRRKNLRNSLKGVFPKDDIDEIIASCDLDSQIRGEEVSAEMFLKLAKFLPDTRESEQSAPNDE